MEAVPSRTGVLAESGENYLETILVIKARNEAGIVRAIDIANELGLSKPSVSRALAQLKEKGLIKILSSGAIVFTPEGQHLASSVFERHQLLTLFLQETAGVPFDLAEHDACRIEHVVSSVTMNGIRRYLEEKGLIPPSPVLAGTDLS